MNMKGRYPAEMAVFTESQIDRYLADGGISCPYCDSGDIVASNQVISEDGTITFDCECTNCLREWKELYRLVGIMPIEGDAQVHGTSN